MNAHDFINAINTALNGINPGNDRISAIKAIFTKCDVAFPYGECQGILAALSENTFEAWEHCSFDEAKEFANNGIPAIAINDNTIYILAPDEINSSTINNSDIVKTADMIDQRHDLTYYAYSGNRATVSGLVYISPSNQGENVGAGKYGTEKERMEQLATSLLCWFKGNGVNAKIATLTKSLDDRIAESKKLGATIYLPLHSNGFDGTAQRPFTVYTSGNTNSKNLASTIQTNLHALYKKTFPNATMRPIAANTDGYDFKEIRSSLISPAYGAYVEVAFHDNLDDANWIIDNMVNIAANIGKSVKSKMS